MDQLSAGVPVAIHLETHIKQDQDVSDYRLDVDGQLVQVGANMYLRYLEPNQETGEQVPVTMKFTPNGEIHLTRNAEAELRLHFVSGKRVTARYRTPYGIMPIETVTPYLEADFKERPFSGNIKIDYLLYAGEQLVGNYKIRLHFTA
ncbi:DUF1934 domain-containing protein [Levilactobacillus zymae]|uniref:Uncharacterized protein n=1 Tax=Levilactobacillus zymae TaxID=267363 RepID=A0A1Y6JWR8_9LACO|nr:DUF1934 domain-containing protein [Levilactobacillus zymae]KRL15140.1 hypothetical protein FD38_GL000952 [Levilactobacillus zymae DSM 19395]QFR61429.1 DUF1934 family protein [Levilactobacillus zymae]GEO71693.1 hypothetical protein LZY01_08610 [Levilactobacillus zymae]SMS13552.1 FIG00743387: hypothetical protein [Levilactobacillus zymae]